MKLPYNSAKSWVFSYGRVALYAALVALKIKPGENVLVPVYICNSVIAPFNYLGIKVKYYAIDQNLKVDMNSLAKALDPGTRAVLAVNYFGFPQPLDDILEFCQRSGIYCIEDNAHGFLSKIKGVELGTRGDIGILSFRKSLPVPNGAALLQNRDFDFPVPDLGPELRSARKDEILLLKKALRSLKPKKTWWDRTGVGISDLYRVDPPEEENNLSKYFVKYSQSFGLLATGLDAERWAANRRRRYQAILAKLSPSLARPIFSELPEGVAPYYCAVQVNGSVEDYILKIFAQEGLRGFPWPALPVEVGKEHLGRYPYLSEIVCFPV